MKEQITSTMKVIALILLASWVSGCKKKDDPKPIDPQEQIKKTWTLGTSGYVIKDGIDVTTEYPGLTVTINADGTYTTTQAKKLFFPSGTWSWVGTGTIQFLLDGDIPVSVTELTQTNLAIQFNLNREHVNPNGRVEAVVGEYKLLLITQ
ncbi:MAG TPA: hypothetical protein VIT44_19065 [Cyclobacteriaceae bacterium]